MFVTAAKIESEKISNVDRIGWGIVMTLMGLVRNWSGLMASRWFLGLAEAGLFPGINFYLSCWYRRSELGIRASIFVAAAAISGSFGGLLAAAIEKMNGLGGRPGWAWLFILEGIMTVIFGIASFWKVQDFPNTAKFLSPVERAHVLHRLQVDRQNISEDDEFRLTYLWMAFKDCKTWLAMAIFAGVDMPTYALSMFLPSIINELGYSSTKAQLLSAAPYVAGSLVTLLIGWLGDRTHQRGLCNIFIACLGIIGFTLLLTFHSPHVRYAGTFFGAMGTYPCVSNIITWVSNNIEGSYKRGIVIGLVIGWGNLNGIISSNIYFHAPDYVIGHATVIGYLSVFLLGGSLLMRWLLKRENRLRRSGKRDHRIIGLNSKALKDLGDAHPGFMYTL
ncbi:hypothetical protein K3495_g2665 [Podosphaera aphanis]|nr:hypothetical protein K3495_g2665 [Podosphaera aphanis]